MRYEEYEPGGDPKWLATRLADLLEPDPDGVVPMAELHRRLGRRTAIRQQVLEEMAELIGGPGIVRRRKMRIGGGGRKETLVWVLTGVRLRVDRNVD